MPDIITADCGNTHAHLALISLDSLRDPTGAGNTPPDPAHPWHGLGGSRGPVFSVSNRGGRDAIDAAWTRHAAADRNEDIVAVIIGSVNPLGENAVADWVETSNVLANRRPPVLRINREVPIPIANLTRRPDQVGQDRLLNSLACRYRYPGRHVVVVDFGTAITFDIVSPAGEYCGGVIAPGVNLALTALHERTALLPMVRPKPGERPPVLGTDTESAILSGVYHGFPGLVLGILQRLAATFDSPPVVVATGGDGATLQSELPDGTFDDLLPFITHEGIALAWLAAGKPV